MTNLEALYRNICQFPDENSYRLIYADCLDEQDDADSKTLAEYIRLSIALENPPQEASMVSISEWKSRETLGAEMVKRMWRKWTECVCVVCNGNGGNEPDAMNTWTCKVCNGSGDILKEKLQQQIQPHDESDTFFAVAGAIVQRRLTFRRGFLNVVYAQRLSDVWKDGKPTLWADALVTHTPIDIIMVNDLHPSSIRLAADIKRRFLYRWYSDAVVDSEGVVGQIPWKLFEIMRSIHKEEIKDIQVHHGVYVPNSRNEWRIECSSLQEAKSLCGRALGRMVREAVYGKQEQMAISEEQRK